ncbi:MAG: hypothetical protein M1834_008956 [Cirrosporium novae-zelandiae]|nr:MAG: hypothetical protein M1834_008956 [Cirrosporium novae-zelandiae]
MASIDSITYLKNGGYLQKGTKVNLREADIEKKVHDLLPSRWFRDEKIFQLERRAIFSRLWHLASFTARFKKPGDYLTLEMFGWPFFLIRDKKGNINAFHNICRHRGHPVITKQYGSSTVLSCRFHGWSYLPTGELHKARDYMDLQDFDPKSHSLFQVHTHTTAQGFIFVNFDAAETPSVSFGDQFGDDFDPNPTSTTGCEIGNEYEYFQKHGWEYDNTWESSTIGTQFNWKTFTDGFQECYHCPTGHPTTLPKDYDLKNYYLRQGIGASRHFLPLKTPSDDEAYITWLYPIGFLSFSKTMLCIFRFSATGVLNTSYHNEMYRRADLKKPSTEYDEWYNENIPYWRLVDIEDLQLAIAAQKGFSNGVFEKGRVHPVQEHAVKWYQDKVRTSLLEHIQLENKLGKNFDYSIPHDQREYDESDPICKHMGPEYEW